MANSQQGQQGKGPKAAKKASPMEPRGLREPGQVSSVENFRKRKGVELTLPSGEVCLVKRPGLEKLLKSGIMPDTLTPIAMKHIKAAESGGRPDGGKSADDEVLDEIMKDPSQMGEMFLSFDRATAMCVIQPPCRMHLYTDEDASLGEVPEGFEVGDEIPDDHRRDDILYTDDVDQEDKMFIFQFVIGGTSDLETFRREQAAGLANP